MTRHRILGVFGSFACLLLAWPSLAQQSRELWVARHDGPVSLNDAAVAIAVDSTGNSYVTGEICAATDPNYPYLGCTDLDWETVKYDTNGNALWTARFAGVGNSFNYPSAIALDASGNVYVIGEICTGAASDYVSSYCSYSDYATIKYDPKGTQLWVARYNGSGSYYAFGTDGAAAVAVDSSGNVYITGTSYGADFLPHYATLKYDANGNTIWVARYNGPGNGSDYAAAIGLDPLGNVYVTGGSTGVTASLDYATIKYDPAGNQLWVERYDGPASGDDSAVALAVGTSGNVYVTGYSGGTGTSDDYATIKYDSTGNQLWLARYDGPAHGMDRATAIALDSNENVHVTGFSSGTDLSLDLDYATLKYDSNGNQMWVARYDGPAHGRDWAHSIAVDAFGRVTVTGESEGIGTGLDYATIQYSPQGATNWVDRYDGPGHGDDMAAAVAVDSSGNAYVTGTSFDPVTNNDWATLKLSPVAIVLSVSPNSVSFATQLLNTASAAQVIAVSNSGSTPIQITGITTAGDFAQTNNCGAAVGPNSVCNVYVTFTPSAIGTHTGSMTVSANTIGAQLTVSLDGTGVYPAMSESPHSLSFGNQIVGSSSVPQTVILSNTGTAPLQFNAIYTTGDFSETTACSSPLVPGTSCSITIVFTPTARYARTGTVVISSRQISQTDTVTLRGTGTVAIAQLSPGSLNFGNQRVNTSSASQNVTLLNAGDGPLTLNTIFTTGPYRQTNNCGSSIASGTGCNIAVVFTPTVRGTVNGTLSITGNQQGTAPVTALVGTGH